MTPEQQQALEALAGRALTSDEITALQPYLDARNDVAIAQTLSVGRVKLIEHEVTYRGVRSAAGIVGGSRFKTFMQSASTAEPAWLRPALTAIGVPSTDHDAYAETLASAHDWLSQEAGIDVGSKESRNMLDLIAANEPALADAVASIKKLAEISDPVQYPSVSDALNKAEGRMTL